MNSTEGKNIRKIESIENPFVKELDQLLSNVFKGMPFNLNIDYFIGEDSDYSKYVYFEIEDDDIGNVFSKVQKLKSYQVPADVEDKFISEIINELMATGIGFIILQKTNPPDSFQPVIKVKGNVASQIINLN